ncbi:hypothetical protein JCM10908_001668 [Rhodotorula pacifica]|uniref:uncharacterized protein n=1 Tax=Rhodotorula pacifica TaxID=1495444 RepID=UPI00317849E7
MNLHGLQLPRPAPRDALPPMPSTSTASTSAPLVSHHLGHSSTAKAPPRNFAEARSAARAIRGDRIKTPFVRKTTAGKERDLTDLSVEQLSNMLAKNAQLLDSPETFAKLPGGDARIRCQQRRIADRISELNAVSQIKHDLDSTHLDDAEQEDDIKPRIKREGEGAESKIEEAEGDLEVVEVKPRRMQDVVESGPADEATSPSAKRRIAAQVLSRSPQSLTAGMSLSESIEIQKRAVERERKEHERKTARMQVDAKRPTKTGELLRGALGVDSALSGYIFQADDSDESLDEDEIDDWLNQGRKGHNGELNDEEDAQLNPLRTAYLEGWNRAEQEG